MGLFANDTKLAATQPHKAVNITLNVVIQATGVPAGCPGFQVPAGLPVLVHAAKASGANANPVRIATNPEVLQAGGGRTLTPDTEVPFPVDNTAQIWFVGTAGDGLILSLSGVPLG